MSLKLSILILTLESRAEKLARLLAGLTPQLNDQVEILQDCDAGQRPSGNKRNGLLAKAAGDYVAFVDDDDEVADDYVASLLAEIEHGPDVVTFDLLMSRNGNEVVQSFSLFASDGPQWGDKVPMAANHLNAWRRELATMVRFPDWLGYGDDQFWYKPLVASGVAKTERHIDKILYRYYFSAASTANQGPDQTLFAGRWASHGVECFWHDGQIVVSRYRQHGREQVVVYDKTGREFSAARKDLQPICICHLT